MVTTSSTLTTQQTLGEIIKGNGIKPGNITTINMHSIEKIEILAPPNSFDSSKEIGLDVGNDGSYISDGTQKYENLPLVPATFTTEQKILKFQAVCSPNRDEETENRTNEKLTYQRNENKDLSNMVDFLRPPEANSREMNDRRNISQMTIIRFQGGDKYSMSQNNAFRNSSNILLKSMDDKLQDSNVIKHNLGSVFLGSRPKIVKDSKSSISNPIIMARSQSNSISGGDQKHDKYGHINVLRQQGNSDSFFQQKENNNLRHDNFLHANKRKNVSELVQSRQIGLFKAENSNFKGIGSKKEQRSRLKEASKLSDIISFSEYESFHEHKGYQRRDGETYSEEYVNHQNLTKDYKNVQKSNESLNLLSFLESRPVGNKNLSRIEFSEPEPHQILRLHDVEKGRKDGNTTKSMPKLDNLYGYEQSNSRNLNKLRNAYIQLNAIKNFQINDDEQQYKHQSLLNDSSAFQSVSKFHDLDMSDEVTIGKFLNPAFCAYNIMLYIYIQLTTASFQKVTNLAFYNRRGVNSAEPKQQDQKRIHS